MEFIDLRLHYSKHVIPEYHDDWDYFTGITEAQYKRWAELVAGLKIDGVNVLGYKQGNKTLKFAKASVIKELRSIKGYQWLLAVISGDGRLLTFYPVSNVRDHHKPTALRLPVDDDVSVVSGYGI